MNMTHTVEQRLTSPSSGMVTVGPAPITVDEIIQLKQADIIGREEARNLMASLGLKLSD